MRNFKASQLIVGILASAGMLSIFFGLITLLSGFPSAVVQWQTYWPYVSALAIGFGIQMTLWAHLRDRQCREMGAAVATSGVSGAVAMVACCAHHLTDFIPVLGVSGLATLVAASQLQIFWVGIVFNLAGLIYLGRRVLILR